MGYFPNITYFQPIQKKSTDETESHIKINYKSERGPYVEKKIRILKQQVETFYKND